MNKCLICKRPLRYGIHIHQRFICLKCEERMVNSNMDTDFYKYYMDIIKKNLVHKIDTGGEKYHCQNHQ